MIFRTKSPPLSKGNLLPLEPVEVSHAYALEEGNHQKGNVGAAKTIIRDEYCIVLMNILMKNILVKNILVKNI